jgi:hypothetical protein
MPSIKPLALALSLLPMCLAAQESSSDTSGLHAGQWGVQVGTSGSLMNLGILRFTGPRSAWMLLVDFNGQFLSGTQTDALGSTSDAKDRSVTVAVGLGKRFYQAPRDKVRSFQSIGLAGGYNDQKQTIAGNEYTFDTWNAGLLGELGAGYWVTPNLSLGGTATASAGYLHRKTDGPGNKMDENGWFVSGVNVFLIVGLYF